MIDKIKSSIFNFDLILSIAINYHNIKFLTLRSLKYALTYLTTLYLAVYVFRIFRVLPILDITFKNPVSAILGG
jgi:hypothetical protein